MEFVGPKTKEEIDDLLKTRIESLCLSTRIENALINASIRTVGGILRKNGDSLLEVDGIGTKGIEEITKELSGVFDVKIDGINFKFIPRYYEVEDFSPEAILKSQTDEDIIREKDKINEDIIYVGPRTKDELDNYMKTRVDSLSFSRRVENALLRESIRTIGGIVRKSGQSLLEVDGIGTKGIEEITKELSGVFDVKIDGRDFRFIPKYLRLVISSMDQIFKEQTEEEKTKEDEKKKEIQIIEEKYFEKQEERKFIHRLKIVSLDINTKIETILLSNNILTVGGLLGETTEDLKEKYSLSNEEVNLILDVFNYLILKNTQIEEEQEKLRIKAFEIMGFLPRILEKKEIFIAKEDIKISQRNLNIFNLFRSGLTLDQIGKENNITRERARQIIKIVLEKMGLSHEEEKIKILSKRNELKPKKVIKEKKWGAGRFDFCINCNTTEFPHSKRGLCEKCDGAFSGQRREKIITQHDNKCDSCGITRDETKIKYGRDLYISKKMDVFCKKCYLKTTGKILGDRNKNKWKMFYK